ncbi:MAG: right-handed parallel beta-helix repeat-containing protein, partial [Planctomycetes bacterium]|nr:right-handed parallel beta-helix repeat-containing protein [Planctomycetota bacterium]
MLTQRLSPASTALLLMVLGLSLPMNQAGWAATDFYIAPSGNDQWSGRLASPRAGANDGPFATLSRAREAIRALKESTGLPEGGVTVWIAAGTYALEQGLDLTAADSGAAGKPIIYRAAAEGQVRITGGKSVTGWRKVQDDAILARFDPAAREHVLEADLKGQGVTDYGTFRSRGFGRSTVPATLELFLQDRPMTLAQWPNDGFEKIAGTPDAVRDEHGGTLGKLPAGFHYEGDRPRRWADSNDIWIHGYWAYDWANSYEHIASLDKEKRLIKTSPPHGNYGFRKGQRFYFLNILEELDQPGEWYLDRATGLLYFWPPAPLREDTVTVSLAQKPLIRVRDASHVQIRGLTLEGGRADGVQITGGSHNLIADCTIRDMGNSGITIDGGTGHGVVNCVIYQAGDGGIALTGGDRRTLTPAQHYATNNHIHHVARWSRCYAPAIAMSGVGIQASNNLIHDHPHCAILFWGNEHTIERNEIHHVCLETGDVGAIYTGRDYTFRGNVIRHNFIHHTGGVGMGSMGIYMDDCVSGTHIYGNILWKLHRAVFLGGGRDFKVENNIFVDCTPAVELDGRGLSQSAVWHDMVYKTMKQRLEEVSWREPPYRTRYPELADLEPYYAKNDGVPPGNVLVARNVCVGSELLKITWGAKEGAAQSKDNLVNADPLFVDAAQGDFRLRPESPAYPLGFKPIPFEKIGRQPPSASS